MRRIALIMFVVAAMALAACGRSDTESPEQEPAAPAATAVQETEAEGAVLESGTLPEVNPLEIEGDIIIAGSSTVFPLAEAMAERFTDEGYGGNITIDSIGSGAGFERFCVAGESDISNASRPIRDSEIESCNAIGREPLEFRVGTDALAIVVNPDNEFVGDGVTLEELALIFSDQSETWADVNPEWPEEPILRFSPGTDSGTFDFFVEAVMDEAFEGEGAGEEALLNAGNLQLSEDDNVLVQGVVGDTNAIGYFGYAYFEENADVLKVLSIEGVEPTAETVDQHQYPLSRPLFMYSDATIIQEKPQVGAFLNFVLTNVNDEIVRVGYFPASEEALNSAKAELATALSE